MFKKKKILTKCNHEYVFFNKCKTPRWMGSYLQWKYEFICTKCEHTTCITEDEIEEELKEAERTINKIKVLGKEVPYKSEHIVFSVCGYPWNNGYEGEYVGMVIEKYKNRGIDLLKIKAQ